MRCGLNSSAAAGGVGAVEMPAEDEIDIHFRTLGFRTLPARGGIVTNELIDRLREQEGV